MDVIFGTVSGEADGNRNNGLSPSEKFALRDKLDKNFAL